MTNYPSKPLRKNSTEVAAINAIQAAVLMFVTFSFFISISSAQAKMSNQQCLNKIEELDEKYGFQEGEYTADDYKYEYAKLIQMIRLMEDGCANSVPVVKKFGEIDIADGKSHLETIRAKCEKVTGDPNCGYTQTTNNQNQSNNNSQTTQNTANDATTDANNCIKPDSADNNNYGSVTNTCNFDVNFSMCFFKPTEKSVNRNISCEKQKFGADRVKAEQRKPFDLNHAEKFYWYACKAPAIALDSKFVDGEGVRARCKKI